MAYRAFSHPSLPAPHPAHASPATHASARLPLPLPPTAPWFEFLRHWEELEPPGFGIPRPPSPRRALPPAAPPTAPARTPLPALARRARKRAPAPASQPAAPRIELLLLMRVLDPPGIGDIRPPQPAPPIPPAAPPTAPARAPQPALAAAHAKMRARCCFSRPPRGGSSSSDPWRCSIRPASTSYAHPARVAPIPPAAPPTAPSTHLQPTLPAAHSTTRPLPSLSPVEP